MITVETINAHAADVQHGVSKELIIEMMRKFTSEEKYFASYIIGIFEQVTVNLTKAECAILSASILYKLLENQASADRLTKEVYGDQH